MKKITILILSFFVIAIICISACSRRMHGDVDEMVSEDFKREAAPPPAPAPPAPAPPAPAPPPPAPPPPAASRYAILEDHFAAIASTTNAEDVNNRIQEVLEMCESGEIPVLIYLEGDEPRTLISELGIREYMSFLEATEFYGDRIDDVSYNDDGKITSILLSRNEKMKILLYVLEEQARIAEEQARIAEEQARIAEEQAVESEIKTFTSPSRPPPAAGGVMPPSAATAPATSRYAPIEKQFRLITSSDGGAEEILGTMKVLEKCESDAIPVFVYSETDGTRELILNVSIREYIRNLAELRVYEDRIDQIDYNDEGQIIEMILIRE
ncbi:hypothetical protein ACFLQX_01865 [Bacteroidota bacterium]